MPGYNWKDIAELVGMTAIVASLIFVGLQLKQDRDLAITEATIATFANLVELHSQQNQYIGIWNSGNAGLELDSDQQAIYRNLVRDAHLSSYFIWASFHRAGLGDVSFVVSDFSGFLYRNSGARQEWESIVEEIDAFRVLPSEERVRRNDWEGAVRARLTEISNAYD